jgi:type I restriction enzyme, R subunit
VKSAAQRALYNNLGKKQPALALAIDAAVKESLMDGWRENPMKTKKVKLAIRFVLATEHPADESQGIQDPGASPFISSDLEAETDRILKLVMNQNDY